MPRKSENHDRIIDAARSLFYQKGYSATSFSDIAEAANIPRGNFYYYFKSKNELLESVIDAHINDLRQLLQDLEDRHSDPRQRIRAYLELPLNLMDDVSRHGCPLGSLITELCKSTPAMRERSGTMLTLLRDWLNAQLSRIMATSDATTITDQIIVRQQGAAVLASTYSDPGWVKNESEALKGWLDQLA